MAYDPVKRKQYYENNKAHSLEYSRKYNLERKFKLSSEEYKSLEEAQKGLCALCFNKCTRKLAVDHDHSTGKIRALLCNKCNRGLGYFKDEYKLLMRAYLYLKAHKQEET